MFNDLQKVNNQEVPDLNESQNRITLQGRTPKEVQADLLAGESDDLTVDFTNVINYSGEFHEGGSN
jgi:hypothetical protein